MLQRNRADLRKVGSRRDQIICQITSQELSIAIIHQVFHKGPTEALYGRADHLPVQGQRIDDPTHILDYQIIDEFYPARSRVDGDMRCGGTISIGEPVIVGKAGIRLSPSAASSPSATDRPLRVRAAPSVISISPGRQPKRVAAAARILSSSAAAPSSTADPANTVAREAKAP